LKAFTTVEAGISTSYLNQWIKPSVLWIFNGEGTAIHIPGDMIGQISQNRTDYLLFL
jgi:hypothetical protein